MKLQKIDFLFLVTNSSVVNIRLHGSYVTVSLINSIDRKQKLTGLSEVNVAPTQSADPLSLSASRVMPISRDEAHSVSVYLSTCFQEVSQVQYLSSFH